MTRRVGSSRYVMCRGRYSSGTWHPVPGRHPHSETSGTLSNGTGLWEEEQSLSVTRDATRRSGNTSTLYSACFCPLITPKRLLSLYYSPNIWRRFLGTYCMNDNERPLNKYFARFSTLKITKKFGMVCIIASNISVPAKLLKIRFVVLC